jgi:phosphoenolpyruvate carboxykinase (GTP)
VKNEHLEKWVKEVAALTQPDKIVWCDGSEEEGKRLLAETESKGIISKLNQEKFPGCYISRSDPGDVARVEHLTFICTPKQEDVGPTNNWMAPEDAKAKLTALFQGSMKGRTMYVVPYLMGPVGSPFSQVGVELTDSIYVVINMRIMCRMGKVALDHLGQSDNFVRGLHCTADLNPERRFICHFPSENLIWSIGSGYGGNALLGKKCHALRLASNSARREGWLAEHMLILGIEDPKGEVTYIAAAFPSACGKTNLAMLVPTELFKDHKVWTVGDDIAWMRYGDDGRLYAVNPEAGFFGVVPGTSSKTNPNAMTTIRKNTIYTNVALNEEDNTPWWEGMDGPVPKKAIDWKGNPWTPESKEKAAHPNSRFTTPARQCPCISPEWENPKGVPISAIIFGGRRAHLTPLVYESFDWDHGTYIGATMASETTAAATSAAGVLRRDPMAMIPFCGYNMADYFQHWMNVGKKGKKLPKIFHVNWFRKDDAGKFLWPGFGENIRVLKWVLERCKGSADATKTPIGYVPTPESINLKGLNLEPKVVEELLAVKPSEWKQELEDQKEFFKKFGSKVPDAVLKQHAELEKRLGA